MKIAHWTEKGLRSGLGHTSLHFSETEKKAGLESVLIDGYKEDDWCNADDADIHVIHLFMPPKRIYGDDKPKIWVAHGTPEVMWWEGQKAQATEQYAAPDGWMIAQWWLQHADAIVTFWPRHEAIWRSLSDKNTRIEGMPLGVDLDFWKPVKSLGKFAGEPSMFVAENCYDIKAPLDLFVAWPWVVRSGLPDAKLHAVNIPYNQNRFWFTLANRNGSAFHSYITNRFLTHEELRNAFCSTDYYCNLVRYGDHNYIGLQASACGMKVISYTGNQYADYWVEYGDQRILAQQLTAIAKGEVKAREKQPAPSITRTTERFIEVYKSLLKTETVTSTPKRIRVRRPPKPETKLATATIQ